MDAGRNMQRFHRQDRHDYSQPISFKKKPVKSKRYCSKLIVGCLAILTLCAIGLSAFCLVRVTQVTGEALKYPGPEKLTDPERQSPEEMTSELQQSIDKITNLLIFANKTVAKILDNNDLAANNDATYRLRTTSLLQSHDLVLAEIQQFLVLLNSTSLATSRRLKTSLNRLNRDFSHMNGSTRVTLLYVLHQLERNQEKIADLQRDSGWISLFNSYQYLVERSGMNFTDARAFCRSKGGDLATVGMRNNVSRSYLTQVLVPSKTIYGTWIGLADRRAEGEWAWLDGVRASAANTDFVAGEPNNSGGGQDCAYLHKFDDRYRMADFSCASRFSALCERHMQRNN